MVAVCRMVPQAAFLEQDLAVRHRRPEVVQHRLVRLGHRVSKPVYFKRPHRVSGPPATTLQFTGLVNVGTPTPEGTFCSLRPRGRPGATEEGFCVSASALMASEGFFCQLAGSLLHSELRQQRATALPTLWTVHRRIVESPGHTGARRGVHPASG